MFQINETAAFAFYAEIVYRPLSGRKLNLFGGWYEGAPSWSTDEAMPWTGLRLSAGEAQLFVVGRDYRVIGEHKSFAPSSSFPVGGDFQGWMRFTRDVNSHCQIKFEGMETFEFASPIPGMLIADACVNNWNIGGAKLLGWHWLDYVPVDNSEREKKILDRLTAFR